MYVCVRVLRARGLELERVVGMEGRGKMGRFVRSIDPMPRDWWVSGTFWVGMGWDGME